MEKSCPNYRAGIVSIRRVLFCVVRLTCSGAACPETSISRFPEMAWAKSFVAATEQKHDPSKCNDQTPDREGVRDFKNLPTFLGDVMATEQVDAETSRRMALLVDRQWTWRQNQVLTRRLQASRLKGACP